MKFLGIDYGGRRVGIAVSDDRGSIAFPRDVFPNDSTLIDSITQMVEEESITHIICGDTRAVGGAENPVTLEAEEFMEALRRATGKPVARAFEGWSSIEASRYAPKGEEHNDAAAAAIILQRYLDMKGGRPES